MGLLAGADYNLHQQDVHYMTDYRIRGAYGVTVGISGQYAVSDWLSFRVDTKKALDSLQSLFAKAY